MPPKVYTLLLFLKTTSSNVSEGYDFIRLLNKKQLFKTYTK